MKQQLFLQQLAKLPVTPIPLLDSRLCQGLRVVIIGEANISGPAVLELTDGGASVIEVMTDLPQNEAQIPRNIAKLLATNTEYDALVLASAAELSLINLFAPYRAKIVLYRAPGTLLQSLNLTVLHDEVSKRVMSQQMYLLQHNCYLDGFSDEAGAQYFHPMVQAQAGEQILCIGPYLGKPFVAFDSTSGGDFTAHCLEANPFTYAELCINLVSWGMHSKVRPVCAGAWSSTGMVAFASEGHTGGGNVLPLDAGGPIKPAAIDMAIFAYAVDDYVRESGFVPSLIESGRIGIGTEVVKGAKATIIRHKPKLILLDYPDTAAIGLIMLWVPEYKVYYSECGRGSYGVFFLSV